MKQRLQDATGTGWVARFNSGEPIRVLLPPIPRLTHCIDEVMK